MVESDDLGSNSFTDTVKREGVVSLVKLGVRCGGPVDDGFVVAEHVRLIKICWSYSGMEILGMPRGHPDDGYTASNGVSLVLRRRGHKFRL